MASFHGKPNDYQYLRVCGPTTKIETDDADDALIRLLRGGNKPASLWIIRKADGDRDACTWARIKSIN